MIKVGIIGTTTWGTALGVLLARNGKRVRLWARSEDDAQKLNAARENVDCLPGIKFPFRLWVTASLEETIKDSDMLVLAVPAQTMRQNVKGIGYYLKDSCLIISAAKGLEVETSLRMSEVIAEEIPLEFHPNICALSGPNLALEIAKGLPSASSVAAYYESVAVKAQQILTTDEFSVYTSTDMIGVELGGALKNIIAIGAGIVEGLGCGDNAKAAFVTQGLSEITRLGTAAGAETATFLGLSGVGDVITTCISALSRNHYVGIELAKGRNVDELTRTMTHVAEGIYTIIAARQMARQLGVKTPIIENIYQILFRNASPKSAVEMLLNSSRELIQTQ